MLLHCRSTTSFKLSRSLMLLIPLLMRMVVIWVLGGPFSISWERLNRSSAFGHLIFRVFLFPKIRSWSTHFPCESVMTMHCVPRLTTAAKDSFSGCCLGAGVELFPLRWSLSSIRIFPYMFRPCCVLVPVPQNVSGTLCLISASPIASRASRNSLSCSASLVTMARSSCACLLCHAAEYGTFSWTCCFAAFPDIFANFSKIGESGPSINSVCRIWYATSAH